MDGYREAASRVLVVAFGKGVRGLDALTGNVLWEVEPGAASWRLQVSGEHVVAAGGQQLLCLRYPTGEILWLTRATLCADALLFDGELIYLTSVGEVECFDLRGNQLWHNKVPGKGAASAALAVPGKSAQVDHRG